MDKILSSISLIALTIINDLQVGKFKQRGVSVPSTLKAVPVAVMLAMSPMVTQAQTTLPEGTTVFEPKNPHKPLRYLDADRIAHAATLLKNIEFKNAAPGYGDCTVSFLSTDDDYSNAEMVALTFEKRVMCLIL